MAGKIVVIHLQVHRIEKEQNNCLISLLGHYR